MLLLMMYAFLFHTFYLMIDSNPIDTSVDPNSSDDSQNDQRRKQGLWNGPANAIFFDNDNLFNDEVRLESPTTNNANAQSIFNRNDQYIAELSANPSSTTDIRQPAISSTTPCSCVATAEYNPVCGSDDVTYWNIGRFMCAKRCSKISMTTYNSFVAELGFMHQVCYFSLVQCNEGSRKKPDVSLFHAGHLFIASNPLDKSVELKIPDDGHKNQRGKRQAFWDAPNNGIFFDNDNLFNDQVRPNRPVLNNANTRSIFNPNIPNPSNWNVDPFQNREVPPNPSGTTDIPQPGMGTTRSPCEDQCITTNEYNPVCADNDVTYFNMGRFRCALRCRRTKIHNTSWVVIQWRMHVSL
ncbi:uncharacterized protein LOC132701422 [Cylas formicarius]|uniref:uncharacterized protein LOC132701422 n=1 Tax=Cylas formicarius TaxID=197179 RepID=UPI0029586503|nr:uncharacterized protein LOC132701422 [Cylas formicarius]